MMDVFHMQCIHIYVSEIISFKTFLTQTGLLLWRSAEVVSAGASRELAPLLSAGVRLRPD